MFVDTSLLIDFLRGKEEAIDAIKSIEPSMIFTSEINVFELVTGIYMSSYEIKPHLEKVTALISKITVLPLDRKAAIKAGEIAGNLAKQGKMVDGQDCLIAGIALSNGITEIITANKSHFERVKGLKALSY